MATPANSPTPDPVQTDLRVPANPSPQSHAPTVLETAHPEPQTPAPNLETLVLDNLARITDILTSLRQRIEALERPRRGRIPGTWDTPPRRGRDPSPALTTNDITSSKPSTDALDEIASRQERERQDLFAELLHPHHVNTPVSLTLLVLAASLPETDVADFDVASSPTYDACAFAVAVSETAGPEMRGWILWEAGWRGVGDLG